MSKNCLLIPSQAAEAGRQFALLMVPDGAPQFDAINRAVKDLAPHPADHVCADAELDAQRSAMATIADAVRDLPATVMTESLGVVTDGTWSVCSSFHAMQRLQVTLCRPTLTFSDSVSACPLPTANPLAGPGSALT